MTFDISKKYREYLPSLIKAYNEIYFRNYVNTDLYSLSEYTLNDIITLMNNSENLGLIDNEIYNILKDIFVITDNYKRKQFYSNVMINVVNELNKASELFDNLELPLSCLEVINILKDYDSYLVGGCVRDTILGKNPKDFDFVTSLPYKDLKVLFLDNNFSVKETGKEFLVLIVSKDGFSYEIANFRKDLYNFDSSFDCVEIGTINEDYQRRDFVVNSMYYSLQTKTLLDPTGQGLNDIKSKTLRFVGKPYERLKEDPIRALRFLRFINTLGFTPETKSFKCIKSNWDDIYKKSNPGRVLLELMKMV